MKTSVVCLSLISLALVTLCSGCAKRPPTHYYVLEPARDGASEHRSPVGNDGMNVGVPSFRIDAPYDQDRIVYRIGDDSPEIGYYTYHRWAVPLSRMLPALVAESFAGVHGLRSIEPVTPGIDYDAFLEGRCVALEEVDVADGQRVRIRIVLSLRLADGVELWTRDLAYERTEQSREVSDIVERMRDLLGQALAEAAADLERALGELE